MPPPSALPHSVQANGRPQLPTSAFACPYAGRRAGSGHGGNYASHISAALPEIIARYFEFDSVRDIESIVSLFADDATVVDEGETRHGTAEIRAWQTGPASKYTYTTEVHATEAVAADRYLVTGRLAGNFPGGIADLQFDFTIANGAISRLVIAP